MKHFHRSSTYATGFSQADRQRSLPEIRQLGATGESASCSTISKKTLHLPLDKSNSRTLHLPLDKSNSRFLKQSVQNFLHQDGEEKHEDALLRLKLSIQQVEASCDQVCSGHVTSKDKLDRIEQQISSTGKQAASLWSKLQRKTQPEGLKDDSPTEHFTPDALMRFCKMIEDHNDLVRGYCSSLASQGLLSRYNWSEPDEVTAANPYLRAEELMTVAQSREYQVKFCHANVTHNKESNTKYVAAYSKDSTALAGTTSNAVDGNISNSNRDGELCMKLTKNCTRIQKLIIGIGIVIVVLLLTAVSLIAVLST